MRVPNGGEWLLWLITYVIGGYVCLLLSAFMSDAPSSEFVTNWSGTMIVGGIAITAVVSLVLLFTRKVHYAVLLNVMQIVVVQVVLRTVALVAGLF